MGHARCEHPRLKQETDLRRSGCYLSDYQYKLNQNIWRLLIVGVGVSSRASGFFVIRYVRTSVSCSFGSKFDSRETLIRFEGPG